MAPSFLAGVLPSDLCHALLMSRRDGDTASSLVNRFDCCARLLCVSLCALAFSCPASIHAAFQTMSINRNRRWNLMWHFAASLRDWQHSQSGASCARECRTSSSWLRSFPNSDSRACRATTKARNCAPIPSHRMFFSNLPRCRWHDGINVEKKASSPSFDILSTLWERRYRRPPNRPHFHVARKIRACRRRWG